MVHNALITENRSLWKLALGSGQATVSRETLAFRDCSSVSLNHSLEDLFHHHVHSG